LTSVSGTAASADGPFPAPHRHTWIILNRGCLNGEVVIVWGLIDDTTGELVETTEEFTQEPCFEWPDGNDVAASSALSAGTNGALSITSGSVGALSISSSSILSTTNVAGSISLNGSISVNGMGGATIVSNNATGLIGLNGVTAGVGTLGGG
jgi:hypothetical protein